jgi:hypothetical protein
VNACFVVRDHNGKALTYAYKARRIAAKYRQALAEAVIRSVELIIQPDARDFVDCCRAMQTDQQINRTYSSARREGAVREMGVLGLLTHRKALLRLR